MISCAAALPLVARAQVTAAPPPAAHELPRAAVFPTANAEPGLSDLAYALDPVVLAKLGDLQIVQVTTRPGLDLPAAQLTIDCVGETRECLSALAQQVGAPVLIAPSVQRAGEETVVTLLCFDAAGSGEMRTVVRRFAGGDVVSAALDAVPDMLRELFGVPLEPAARAPEAAEPPAPTPTREQAAPIAARGHPFPLAPVLIAAGGVALIAAGTAFALASQANKHDYAHARLHNDADVDAAIALRNKASHQATLANIGFGVGAAALAVGATWLVLDLGSRDEVDRTRATLAPFGGPSQLGLALQGHFARNAW
jgi:hypothetical protein